MDKKQCNYCGSKYLEIAELHDPRKRPIKQKYVQCKECGACGPLAEDELWAILKWNSRIQEVQEIPQERLNIVNSEDSEYYYCPYSTNKCKADLCMMWVTVGEDKGRCGLVNTMYINSTGCSVV